MAMHPAITETLQGLVKGFRPNLAMVSYSEVVDLDGSLGQIASRRRMDVPLAVLIGARRCGIADRRGGPVGTS